MLATRHRIAALFVLSGASGLVFEVIWVRQLARWTGAGTVAVTLVVAAFLLGLVLGSLLGGRLADRGGALVRVYAQLEAVTGLAALAVSALLSRAAPLSIALADHAPAWATSLPVRVVAGFLVVLAPTVAMGATLPVLTRHLSRTRDEASGSLGSLYALNTLGAAAGCALAGFVLLGRFGMVRTAAMAACANLVVAALAWTLDSSVSAPEGPPRGAPARSDGRSLTAIAALTGFSAIACEVLWLRVLHAFVKSSTYAFTLMLVVFLLGLVLGGVIYVRRFAKHPRPWELLSDVQSAQAAATVVSVALLGRSASITAALSGWGVGAVTDDSDLVHLALGAVVIVGPTTLMGLSFPLVLSLGARDEARGLGGAVARLSAVNTLGGAAGSLVTGLALIPLIGTQRSFVLAVTLSLCASLVARARASTTIAILGGSGRTARAALGVALVAALVPRDYLLRAITTFPRARVLAVREGRDGTAAVLGYTRASVCAASPNRCVHHCATDFSYQQLIFGTISYASTIPPAKRYMRALAHLPMLLHPSGAPLDVVEVCFGTGTTAGAFTAHPSLRALTIVDINEDVFDFAQRFADSNRDVLRDPRVRRVVDDGRHHLATAPSGWDIVSLEPPPPTAEGAASLYTREFYIAAKRRMRPGAILAQWIPLEQQTGDLDRAMIAAVLAEFREVEVYIPSREEGVVLASDSSLRPALPRWHERWRGRVAESLADVGFEAPEQLLATRVLDTAGTRAWVGAVTAMTDDLPSVEFYRSHPGERFRVEAMWQRGVRSDDISVRVARLGMLSWERSAAGDLAGARRCVREMASLAPSNLYVRYLDTLEYDCLNLDAP